MLLKILQPDYLFKIEILANELSGKIAYWKLIS